MPGQLADWWADRQNRHHYPVLTESDLRAARKSDTVFICGGGASILSISEEEWNNMSRHDILSFRTFPHQWFVPVDYHVTAEIDDVDEYAALINNNRRYDNTLFLVQQGLMAYMGNRLIGRLKLRAGARVFRYRRYGRGKTIPLSRGLNKGIVHGHGSIVGMVNIAYLLGWKRIVLVGIDLYDHRYFYMPPDETRAVEKEGLTFSSAFTTAPGIVEQIGDWSDALIKEGVHVYSFNEASLLTQRVPAFDRAELSPSKAVQ